MKKVWCGLVVLVAGLQAVGAWGQGSRVAEDRREAVKYGWRFNYADARREARKSGRPLMIAFRCVP